MSRRSQMAPLTPLDPLSDAMPLLVARVQVDGTVDAANQQWHAYVGPPGAASWLSLLHPADQERARATWERAVVAGEIFVMEVQLRRHDESWHWFLARAGRIGARAWVLTLTDIDQQKGLEQTLKDQTKALEDILSLEEGDAALLRQSNDELERRVQQRTRELEVANQRLKEVDRLKSDFLATMSHELRTPLNSIIGFTGIILQGLVGDLNDEQRKQLTLVYHAAQHLLKLISEILDVSRIESGKARIQLEQFDLGLVVNNVVDSLEVMLAERGLQVVLQGSNEGLVVRSDRQKLTQVILNLLGNAIKFTPDGRITVSWGLCEGGFDVRVEDTGIGIRESDLQHLFEPFRQ
ncbi:MAG TPA: PAS domain-containing sensor histidine kinase, partial [Candidatus Xenobia bacterium]